MSGMPFCTTQLPQIKCFIKVMCEALNEKTNQDYIRGLQMDVHFDKFESIIVWRFDLPLLKL